MKNTFFNRSALYSLLLSAVTFSISCKKELPAAEADSTQVALVAVHNFSLLAGTSASVFVNDSLLALGGSNVALGVNGSLLGSYIGVNPGTVKVGVRTSTGSTVYATRTVSLSNASATSFFAFDTLTAAGTGRMLALNNDMKAPASGSSNIRFLHFSPNAGAVNVTLVRTLDQFGIAATGTVTLSNVPYIGTSATPNETALSAFSNIPAGTYTVTVLSGTTTLVSATLTLREGKNYSIVARGFTSARAAIPTGQTLGATLLLHNP